ncbi:MAG: RNA polymerase-binding protein DksA [Gammaproteobacteria bacterium]|nr:RNA polymerase-binding protein DksA [Gammaproteobacteria bacterium]MBI5618938.1 RNA polymerase-binding protein DksA [Gammaproteobacteria bacterium]
MAKAKASNKKATPKRAPAKKKAPVKKRAAPAKKAAAKPVAKKKVAAKPTAAAKKPAAAPAKAKAPAKPAPKPVVKAPAKKPAAKAPVAAAKPAVPKVPAPAVKQRVAKAAPAPKAAPAKATAPAVAKPAPKPEIPKKIDAAPAAPAKPAKGPSEPPMPRKVINLDEIKLPPNYRPAAGEEYMCPQHLAYFKRKLENWRQELILESQETLEHLRTETRDVGDEAERASRESDNILELRTRDRYRKLLHKISEALKRIEEGAYGYCEETGEEIGLGRLEARPIATLTVDAQERRELFQRQFRDDH